MKKAAALSFDSSKEKNLKLIAKGRGELALCIIQKAKMLDIPLFQSESLVDLLINTEVNGEIPNELYGAVVDVFIWLHNIEQRCELSRTQD